MPVKLEWSDAQDDLIRVGRGAGRSWDAIAGELGVSRGAAISRGRAIGVGRRHVRQVAVPRVVEREAFPAGHPITWGAITAGTVLAGAAYRYQSPMVGREPEPGEAAEAPMREAA